MKTSSLFTLLLASLLAHSPALLAQEAQEKPAFFTGISPIILERNAAEVYATSSLSSFWLAVHQYNPSLQITQVRDRQRFTRAETLLRFTYGFSKKKNWDLAFEIKHAFARLDEAARSSVLRVFDSPSVISGDFERNNSYRGLSSVGLRFRYTPFERIPELTLQATAYQPVAGNIAKRYAFGAERFQTGLSATYFIQSGDNIYYFFQADFVAYLKSNEININLRSHYTDFLPALSTIVVIRTWEDKWFVFPGLSYSTTVNSSFYRLNQQLFGSLGLFYQPNPKFSMLLNWQLPLILDSGNRNVEFVKNSYSGFTLGLRTLIEPR